MGSITIDRAVLEQALKLLDDAAGYGDGLSEIDAAYAIIHEALAAPQPEPVAWLRVIDEAMVTHHLGVADPTDDYETAKRKMNNLLSHAQDIGAYFAAPPHRQPLTEEQITEILGDYPVDVRRQLILLVRAVEAMHGIGGA